MSRTRKDAPSTAECRPQIYYTPADLADMLSFVRAFARAGAKVEWAICTQPDGNRYRTFRVTAHDSDQSSFWAAHAEHHNSAQAVKRHAARYPEQDDDDAPNLVLICPHCGRHQHPDTALCDCGHLPYKRKDLCPCDICEAARAAAGNETLAEARARKLDERAAEWDAEEEAERSTYDAEHGPGSWDAMCDAEEAEWDARFGQEDQARRIAAVLRDPKLADVDSRIRTILTGANNHTEPPPPVYCDIANYRADRARARTTRLPIH